MIGSDMVGVAAGRPRRPFARPLPQPEHHEYVAGRACHADHMAAQRRLAAGPQRPPQERQQREAVPGRLRQRGRLPAERFSQRFQQDLLAFCFRHRDILVGDTRLRQQLAHHRFVVTSVLPHIQSGQMQSKRLDLIGPALDLTLHQQVVVRLDKLR